MFKKLLSFYNSGEQSITLVGEECKEFYREMQNLHGGKETDASKIPQRIIATRTETGLTFENCA